MVEVRRKPRENTSALLRRFSSKMRLSGVLREARKRQFSSSPMNDREKKSKALRRIEKKKEHMLSR